MKIIQLLLKVLHTPDLFTSKSFSFNERPKTFTYDLLTISLPYHEPVN